MMRHAFSLIELSIVLVILGLLAGGILSGQALIRAAELRSVSTEYNRFYSATQAFRDKYFALPGDMTNATKFWGTTTASGTADGNGDGKIDNAAAASTTGETYQYWRQLAFAGLIEGTYTGIAGAGSANDYVPGVAAPRSKMKNGAWSPHYAAPGFAGDTGHYAGSYGNFYAFGGYQVGWYTDSALLKPEETWNLDTKLDDGKPGSGKMIAVWWANCSLSTTATDFTAEYRLSSTTDACGVYFIQQF